MEKLEGVRWGDVHKERSTGGEEASKCHHNAITIARLRPRSYLLLTPLVEKEILKDNKESCLSQL